MTRIIGAAASAALVAATVATPASAAVPEQAKPSLTWTSCPYPDSPAELQCASIQVPVDYAHPHGPTATVTVDRLRATGAHPVGSLFFDPGGPGDSGTQFVYDESLEGVHFFSAATRENFDLIGFDPRGVGLSSPIRCDPALLNRQVPAFPKNETEFRQVVARNQALGRSCRQLTGSLMEHVDTVSVARDLEQLRQALGQGKLNYLGLSYGSQLGATYAQLFPDRIRTLALDGAVDHSLSPLTLFKNESRAYEQALNRFFDWCAQTTSCALHGTDVARLFDNLVSTADRTPIPAASCAQSSACRPFVTGADIRLTAQSLLLFPDPIPIISPDGRNGLALALQRAQAGDASDLSQPLATGQIFDNFTGSQIASECLDWQTPIRTFHDLQRVQRIGRSVAPRLGGASQSWTILTGCIGWPAPVVNPPQPIKIRQAPSILITNADHDPSTAYPCAVRLHRDLPSSVLVTRDGDGHTSYLAHGVSHTRDAIDEYLATGRTPPPGTVYTD